MKSYQWIICGVMSIILISIIYKPLLQEGFTSSKYDNCLAKGYSKEFCVQTPVSAYGPSACLCKDGKLGRFIPGFGGDCVCL